MLKIRWQGTPVPQSRPRFYNGCVFEEPKMKRYKAEIKHLVFMQIPTSRLDELPFTDNLSVKINIYKNRPTTSKQYGDIDNHAKAILDALNGFLWLDDSQITRLEIEKFQSTDEGVELEVN